MAQWVLFSTGRFLLRYLQPLIIAGVNKKRNETKQASGHDRTLFNLRRSLVFITVLF